MRFMHPALILTLFLLAPSLASGGSTYFTMSGLLRDAEGNRLDAFGQMAARVVFYDDATTTTVTAVFDTNTMGNVQNGLFNVHIVIPDVMADRQTVWYELALDVHNDGFDADDFFNERFQVFTGELDNTLRPTERFSTSTGCRDVFAPTNRIILWPIITPPGGVRFNRVMTNRVTLGGNLGVYDGAGDLLVETGFWSRPWNDNDSKQNTAVPLSGFLEGATLYYMAFTIPGSGTARIGGCDTIPWPYKGGNLVESLDGSLPGYIENIEQRVSSYGLNFALWFVEEPVSGK